MYIIQKSVDRKWIYQCKTNDEKEAKLYIKKYGVDQVNEFKTCDCLRAIDEETGQVIASHPADFVERS